jgi:hypothetical protein
LSNLKIDKLPSELPHNTESLHLRHTLIHTIPDCPDSLTYLDVSNTWALRSIAYFPPMLQKFICYCSVLESLPSHAPPTLTTFICTYSNIHKLPQLPESVKIINCSRTQISEIHSLPQKLEYLDCSYTNIQTLPPLPNSLKYLDIRGTKIAHLPNISKNLEKLGCDFHIITELDYIPCELKLISIICTHNSHVPTCFYCFLNQYQNIDDIQTPFANWKEHISKARIINRNSIISRDIINIVLEKKMRNAPNMCNLDDTKV